MGPTRARLGEHANFDDDGWASGPAQLGYGDGDEATVVDFRRQYRSSSTSRPISATSFKSATPRRSTA